MIWHSPEDYLCLSKTKSWVFFFKPLKCLMVSITAVCEAILDALDTSPAKR